MRRWAFVQIEKAAPEGALEPLAEALLTLSPLVALGPDGVWVEIGDDPRGGQKNLRALLQIRSARARRDGAAPRVVFEPSVVGDFREVRERREMPCRRECDRESEFAAGLPSIAKTIGCNEQIKIAIADQPATARIIARQAREALTVIPEGEDAAALAALPVGALEASAKAVTYLGQLGIHRASQLGEISPASLRRRLGPEGELLVRLSRAEPLPTPPRYQPKDKPLVSMDLEPPVPAGDPVLFVIKRLLDELTANLMARGLAISALRVSLFFESTTIHSEELLLPRPLTSSQPLLSMLRERLAAIQHQTCLHEATFSNGTGSSGSDLDPDVIEERIQRVEICVLRPVPAQRAQMSIFDRHEIEAEKLTNLMARLTSTLGQDAVFAATLVPTHQPESSWKKEDFLSLQELARTQHAGKTNANVAKDQLPEPPSPRPLFVMPEPKPLSGDLEIGQQLCWQGGKGTIGGLWGPERLRGQWWSAPFERNYFVVDLEEDGSRLWVYRDGLTDALYLHGFFD